MTFPSTCGACGIRCDTRMAITSILHFTFPLLCCNVLDFFDHDFQFSAKQIESYSFIFQSRFQSPLTSSWIIWDYRLIQWPISSCPFVILSFLWYKGVITIFPLFCLFLYLFSRPLFLLLIFFHNWVWMLCL